jgi:hypothetical protein
MNGKVFVPNQMPGLTHLNLGNQKKTNTGPGPSDEKPFSHELEKITGKKPAPPGEMNWERTTPMGMGQHPFALPTAIIPRQFRFLVGTELSKTFQNYVKDLEIDWIGKRIKINLYETMEFDTDQVLCAFSDKKASRPLLVTLFDGCGNPIMGYRFNGVTLKTYSTPLNYESSDVLTNKAVLAFASVDKLKKPAK